MADIKEFAEHGGQALTFIVGGDYYAFVISEVTDIIEIPPVTLIPKTPDYVLGIMNHRGKAVPVMDLRLRLGLPEGEYDERSCIIVTEINSLPYGIKVDRVSDVIRVLPEQTAVSPAENGVVSGFVTQNDKRISMLNLDRLVRT